MPHNLACKTKSGEKYLSAGIVYTPYIVFEGEEREVFHSKQED